MYTHVLLNIFNELIDRDKLPGYAYQFNAFFETSLIHSIIQEHNCEIFYHMSPKFL